MDSIDIYQIHFPSAARIHVALPVVATSNLKFAREFSTCFRTSYSIPLPVTRALRFGRMRHGLCVAADTAKNPPVDQVFWDGLGDCYEQGLVKAVGVSNYGNLSQRHNLFQT